METEHGHQTMFMMKQMIHISPLYSDVDPARADQKYVNVYDLLQS